MTAKENKSSMQTLVDGILQMMDLLDAGEVTEEELRERTGHISGIDVWIDFAVMLHKCPREQDGPAVTVKNPRYRKGTGMRPAAWSGCLWKPAGVRP